MEQRVIGGAGGPAESRSPRPAGIALGQIFGDPKEIVGLQGTILPGPTGQ